MMHCPICKVEFTGDLDRCALCGSSLEGTPDPSPFPCVPIQRKNLIARRILGGITAAVLIAWCIFCLSVQIPGVIGITVLGALGLNWFFIRNLMMHAPNTLRAIKRYFLVVMVMALGWFVVTRSPIASSLVIPVVALIAILFDAVLLAVQGSRLVEEYGKYVLYDIAFGIIPPLLMLTDTVMWPTLSWSCAVASAAMLTVLLVVNRHAMADETRKLFNA